MMEERRARLRLEIVCDAVLSWSQKKGKFTPSGRKLDPIQISTMHLCSIIKSLLINSEDEAREAIFDFGTVPSKPASDNTIQVLTTERYTAQGLGGLCLTCVRTGEDHEIHSS